MTLDSGLVSLIRLSVFDMMASPVTAIFWTLDVATKVDWDSVRSAFSDGEAGCQAATARSLILIKYKPLGVSCKGMLPFNMGLVTWCFWQSILARMALIRVLETRKGVPPGTMATFNLRGPIGVTIASVLCNVPSFPNLKVM